MARTAMRKSPLPSYRLLRFNDEWERGHQSEGTEGETTPHRTSTRTFGYQRSPEPSFTFGRVGFVMLERFDHQRGAHGRMTPDGPAVIQGLIEIMNGVLGSQYWKVTCTFPILQGRCDCTRFPPHRSIVRLGPFPPRQGCMVVSKRPTMYIENPPATVPPRTASIALSDSERFPVPPIRRSS